MGSKTKHKTGHKSDIYSPSQKARPAPYNIQRGGGGGALEASRDSVTGQKASRAVPIPGTTAVRELGRVRRLGRPWRIRSPREAHGRIRRLGRPWRIRRPGGHVRISLRGCCPQPQSSLQCRLQPQSSLQ